MPPKRKRAAPAPPSPPQEASPSPAPASEDQDTGDHHDGNPFPTLFNTTFALYRVSPLYLGPERLNHTRLQTLSKRLRDTLVGDVVRGVQVGLTGSSSEDATLGRAGALEGVEWRWVPLRKLLLRRSGGSRGRRARRRREREGSAELGSREEDADDDNNENSESEDDEERNTDARALSVELRYENNTFAACLLPRLYKDDSDSTEAATAATSQWATQDDANIDLVADQKQFLQLPLLLLRMPTPLRSVLNDFLARTFDVRIRPLRLGTRPLVSSWAAWHTNSGVSGGRGLVKDVVLSLGFHVVDEPTEAKKQQKDSSSEVADAAKNNNNNHATSDTSTTKSLGLKAIDIIVPAEEVRRFLRAGQRAIQDRDEEASGQTKRKGKRKAGDQPGSEQKPISPSRRRKLAGGKDDEGWAWLHARDEEGAQEAIHEPFTEALGLYLDRHLALDMFHPSVRILRIACEGFVLSEGGRIKVFMPPAEDGSRSAWKLLDGLVERARGRDWGSVPAIPGL
ncbi:hypothetical protein PG993_003621 [Apiospora rasikravindrae]|uniref:Siroheme synthase n=1 Tax=Apiospora rasikravindrae TaxID=990691 RepID=A0ABR1U2A4_9PEZI